MTGFARSQVRVNDQLSYTLSVKSVNHRFLDVQLRLPSGLDALEMELRKALKDQLARGHVELTLSVDRSSQQKAGYNRELVNGYIEAFKAAREEHVLFGEPDLNSALRLPGALQCDNRSNSDEDAAALSESVQKQIVPLLGELNAMRAREGEALEAILHSTLDRLAEATEGVSALRPEVEQRYQERLAQRLQAAVGADFNRQRLLEEVAVLVERSDIAEELSRMATHIGHFRELLAAGGELGKKLDFLLQEMNREANTLLSKTGGVGGKGTQVTELGLAMKAEIEKAREQIQNLE
jgi:uncharacterized protein (TIGR00255 family)